MSERATRANSVYVACREGRRRSGSLAPLEMHLKGPTHPTVGNTAYSTGITVCLEHAHFTPKPTQSLRGLWHVI